MQILGDEDLSLLDKACSWTRSYEARSEIAPEGSSPDRCTIVLEGWAARFRILPDGRRHVSALFLPGDVCDLDGLLLRRIHSGVVALTSCTVAVVPHSVLKPLINTRAAIRDAFWWLCCVENAVGAEWTARFGRRAASEKMAHLFCELRARLDALGLCEADSFEMPLRQFDLADILGLTDVHVNRTLMRLRANGTIALAGRRLTVQDRHALEALGGFTLDYLHGEGLRVA